MINVEKITDTTFKVTVRSTKTTTHEVSVRPSYYNKLGASPQLEWWNAGILEKWVLGYCNIG